MASASSTVSDLFTPQQHYQPPLQPALQQYPDGFAYGAPVLPTAVPRAPVTRSEQPAASAWVQAPQLGMAGALRSESEAGTTEKTAAKWTATSNKRKGPMPTDAAEYARNKQVCAL